MNILIFDPSFVKIDKFNTLVEILNINEIHNLLPHNQTTYNLLKVRRTMVTVQRRSNDNMLKLIDRSIHKIENHFSEAIFENKNYKGRKLFDKFSDSCSSDYVHNINLNQPNILVLFPSKYVYDTGEDNSRYIERFYSSLRKFDTNSIYLNRISIIEITPFIINQKVVTLDGLKNQLNRCISANNTKRKNKTEFLIYLLQQFEVADFDALQTTIIKHDYLYKFDVMLQNIEDEWSQSYDDYMFREIAKSFTRPNYRNKSQRTDCRNKISFTHGRLQCPNCNSRSIRTFCDGTAKCHDCGEDFVYWK